jgi:hypothetical protein
VAADAKRPQRRHGELTGEDGGDWWRGDVDRGFDRGFEVAPLKAHGALKSVGMWCRCGQRPPTGGPGWK